jgi:hypothetical protein
VFSCWVPGKKSCLALWHQLSPVHIDTILTSGSLFIGHGKVFVDWRGPAALGTSALCNFDRLLAQTKQMNWSSDSEDETLIQQGVLFSFQLLLCYCI